MTVVGNEALMLIATSIQPSAELPPSHTIYTVTETEWIHIPLTGQVALPKGERQSVEAMLKLRVDALHFYSETYDCSLPWPNVSTFQDKLSNEFVFNKHLIAPFMAVPELVDIPVVLLQGVALTHHLDADGGLSHYTYLLKKSCLNPGTRMNARGLNFQMGTGNEYEAETIIWREILPENGNPRTYKWANVIVRRGSVPLRWQSELRAISEQIRVASESHRNAEWYYFSLVQRYQYFLSQLDHAMTTQPYYAPSIEQQVAATPPPGDTIIMATPKKDEQQALITDVSPVSTTTEMMQRVDPPLVVASASTPNVSQEKGKEPAYESPLPSTVETVASSTAQQKPRVYAVPDGANNGGESAHRRGSASPGLPVFCISLLRLKNNKGEEALNTAFAVSAPRVTQRVQNCLNKFNTSEGSTYKSISLFVKQLDWHAVRKEYGQDEAVKELFVLFQESLPVCGYSSGEFSLDAHDSTKLLSQQLYTTQQGIMRFNCKDSLDRTNIACFYMTVQCLLQMAHSIGLQHVLLNTNNTGNQTPSTGGNKNQSQTSTQQNNQKDYVPWQSLDLTAQEAVAQLNPSILYKLAEAYLIGGDVCAALYTNSPAMWSGGILHAVKGIETTDGTQIEMPKGGGSNLKIALKRHWINWFEDAQRQKALEIWMQYNLDRHLPSVTKGGYNA
eukprot:TRINITY_DN67791_c8_g3_i1.p1 TRINITY_DN67791_c8_g3~~TRINITY_DN67791_c8_g3_i1.p1  ORF type:complete len:739 (+),score=62.40 TRINITY_DN67791_c8_g3_i1:197-2218(+)